MTKSDSRIWKGLWWAYFALLALAGVSSCFGIHSLLDALLAVFNAYGLVGLWGYLRHLAIGWRRFWIVYFVLFVADAVYGVGLIAWLAWHSHAAMYYYMFAGAILLFAPQCLALWRYGFRSSSIWQAARVAV
ncbi:hypothetical protein [Rhodanobacter sp. L36]|uniref:hypothetical protein n=1 Tax=Rhodanobacter sp. L36 TaxID=1747221 RepID=UPI00131B7191|nr:hypothetical protein [Rhodanobacter sp. L36]